MTKPTDEDVDRLVNNIYERANFITRRSLHDTINDFLARRETPVNDMQLIESLQTKLAALESETGKLREALRLEKQRSEEWKKQAMRLAEDKEAAGSP